MMEIASGRCVVCGAADARALVEIALVGGARATLCGSHALMHRRAGSTARTTTELCAALRERRGRRDRRGGDADALGAALVEAFNGERRRPDRRRTG